MLASSVILPRWTQPAPIRPDGPIPPEIANRAQPPPPGPPPPLPAQQGPAPAAAPPPSAAGLFEKPTTVSITRTFDRPVLNSTRLGSIPQDYYQWTWGWGWPYSTSHHYPAGGDNNFGPVGVYRDVPEQNPDGSPKMRTVTETVTDSTYSELKRTVGCGALGAAAAVGGAALTGSLMGAPASLLGMVIGGVAGAAAGAAVGLKTAQGDTLKEVWVTDSIDKPTFTGYTEWIRPQFHTEEVCHTRTDSQGHQVRECTYHQVLDGYWHQYSPDIAWSRIGTFDRPTLQHTAPVGTFGALGIAAGSGLAIGAVVAAVAAVVL